MTNTTTVTNRDEDSLVEVEQLAWSLASDVIDPAARESELNAAIPPPVWSHLLQAGLTMPIAERFGGDGEPEPKVMIAAVEQFARGDAAIALAAGWLGSAARILGLFDEGLVDDALRSISSGERSTALAVYEPGGAAGPEFATRVSRSPDDRVRVKGRKVAVARADRADHLVVVAAAPEGEGVCAVLIDVASSQGVEVTPWRGLALAATELATVDLDVEIPAERLVLSSEEPRLLAAVDEFRLLTAAAQVGMSARAVDYAADYATSRVAFDKPIASFQGISFLLAEAKMRTDAARLAVRDAWQVLGQGVEVIADAVAYAGESAAQTTRDAVQVLGGHGFITDHPVERWYRTAAALSALEFDPRRSAFQPAT